MSKIEERIKELRLEIDHLSKMVNPFHKGQHTPTVVFDQPIARFLISSEHYPKFTNIETAITEKDLAIIILKK